MATTKSNFLQIPAGNLVGSTVNAAVSVLPMNPAMAPVLGEATGILLLDKPGVDLSKQGYAKNGAAVFNALSGTTKVTLSLLDLTSTTTASGGDTTFATVNQLIFYNTGAADVTIATGSANGLSFGLAGTTPTLTVPAGSFVTVQSVAGFTVASGTKNIDITPTSGGSVAISVGGA